MKSHGGGEGLRIQRGHTGTESERATRPFPQLRLPVIHQVVNEIEAEPDVVQPVHPACVGVEGVRLIVAEQGIPAFRIAQG